MRIKREGKRIQKKNGKVKGHIKLEKGENGVAIVFVLARNSV
jgi:hypothetical protein